MGGLQTLFIALLLLFSDPLGPSDWPMRLLVVEDDPEFGAVLIRSLTRAGYVVDRAQDGSEGLAALRAQAYAAALLDLGLPDMDGLSVLRQARAGKITIPILILSAQGMADQRIAGLDAGADDYLVKPCDIAELEARLRVHIRRSAGLASDTIVVNDLILNPAQRTVTRAGMVLSLSAQEFRIVNLLMLRKDRFVSKDQLETALYDHASSIESNTVEVAIYGLRRKLGPGRILNRRNIGYKII
jgi:two-component system OmpR family response regulator/two-component system response regulator QseB